MPIAHRSLLIAGFFRHSHSGKIDTNSLQITDSRRLGMLYNQWVFLRSHGEVSRPRWLLMRLPALHRGVIGSRPVTRADGPLRDSAVRGGPMLTTRALIFLSLVSFVAVSMPLSAQDSATGSLSGTVFDPAGGRVTQASVVMVNIATTSRYGTTTNAEGRFALALLGTTSHAWNLQACRPK